MPRFKLNEQSHHDLLCRMAETIADELGMTLIAAPEHSDAQQLRAAFFIRMAVLPSGKLMSDVAPDLVIEIATALADAESAELSKIRERWRFDGKKLAFYGMQNGLYHEQNASPTFPFVQAEDLQAFLEQSEADGPSVVLWRLRTLMQKHKPVSN